MSKKKSNNKSQQPISPERYIKEAARKVPIYECLVSNNFYNKGDGLGVFIVARKKKSGNYIVGSYVVDTYCLGVKNTMCFHNFDESEYAEFKSRIKDSMDISFLKIEPNKCFNIIYGALEYAEDLGFKPNKDFSITEYVLDDIETIEYDEIEFGYEGKPLYIAGIYDDYNRIIKRLETKLGIGNFEYIIPDEVIQKSNIKETWNTNNLDFDVVK